MPAEFRLTDDRILLHTPPNTLERIDAVWAYVTVDESGNEGVAATSMPGLGMVPLVAADEARLQSLAPIAQQIATLTGMRLRLIKLGSREEIAVIEPGGGR